MPTGTAFTQAASARQLQRAADALRENNFAAEILQDAAAARSRVRELVPAGAEVFTSASETLRLSGIEEDLNRSGRYDSVKARSTSMDREADEREIWRMIACPQVLVGSVAAVTETGTLLAASASGSQLAGYAGAAAGVIWVVGAQKVVPDLETALRRAREHCLPLENDRAMRAYGAPSALNRMLVMNAEPRPGRGTVLLLREAIGF